MSAANNDNEKDTKAGEKKMSELDKLKKERDEYLDGWKRAKADYINHQKDEIKRMEEALRFGNEDLIKELLPVLDSLELSIIMIDKADEKSKGGVEIIYSQLKQILNKYGLEPIKALGEKFDPSLHESFEEVESEKESGTIVEELSRGWKLYGRVIRPTRAKVAK